MGDGRLAFSEPGIEKEERCLNTVPLLNSLYFPCLRIAVVFPITDNHMVKEMYSHGLEGRFDAFSQLVIDAAGMWVVAGMVMAKGCNSRIIHDSMLHGNPYIHGCLSDATL